MFFVVLTVLAFLCLFPLHPAQAAGCTVFPDGSGDYGTIQQAIDASASGDVIYLGYGRFRGDGNRDLHYGGKALTIRALGTNPELCVLDCEGGPGQLHRAVTFDGEGPGAALMAVTIEGGFVDEESLPYPSNYGGALLFLNGASPHIVDVIIRGGAAVAGGGFAVWSGAPHFIGCRFEENAACGGGGGYCFGGSPEFSGCDFIDNRPVQGGGGLACSGTLHVALTDCRFIGNRSLHGGNGGGLKLMSTSADITRCTFVSNSCTPSEPGVRSGCTWSLDSPRAELYPDGGAIYLYNTPVVITDCTIAGNTGYLGGGIGVDVAGSGLVEIRNSIIAFNTAGGAVVCSVPTNLVALSCSDLYGNAGGDWTGCISDQAGVDGNFTGDPLFCDLSGGELALSPASPCAPEQSGDCGLIGAWPVGCAVTGINNVAREPAGRVRIAPNPTSGGTRIDLTLRPAENVTVEVVDVSGRLIRTLAANEVAGRQASGRTVNWDGRDEAGNPVCSGIYLIRVATSDGVESRPVVVAR